MKRLILSLAAALVLAAPVASYAQTPKQIVEREQQRAGGAEGLKQPAAIVAFLRATAAALNAAGVPDGPFGLLVKTGGHNCNGYSCDIICSGNGSAQKQWDVLVDAGGSSEPVWSGPLSTIAVRPCEIVTSAPSPGPVPVPPAPGPDPRIADLEKAVASLRAEVEQLRAQTQAETRDIRAVLAAESKDLRAIIADLPNTIQLPNYRGNLLGFGITSRPCPTCK